MRLNNKVTNTLHLKLQFLGFCESFFESNVMILCIHSCSSGDIEHEGTQKYSQDFRRLQCNIEMETKIQIEQSFKLCSNMTHPRIQLHCKFKECNTYLKYCHHSNMQWICNETVFGTSAVTTSHELVHARNGPLQQVTVTVMCRIDRNATVCLLPPLSSLHRIISTVKGNLRYH